MSKNEDEIHKKLSELEASLEVKQQEVSATSKGKDVTAAKSEKVKVDIPDDVATKSDLCLIGGLGFILTGLLIFFNHVKVTTSIFTSLGFGQEGFGLVLIPLVVGIGIVFYNYKSRLGWIVTSASCGLIIFAVLSQLIMSFPKISILGLIFMLLPLALGGALIMKGINTRSQG